MNDDLSQMIGKIMANPEFGSLVNQLKNTELSSENTEGKKNAPSPAEVDPAEVAKKIPDLMGMLNQTKIPPSDSAKIEKALGTLKKMDNRNCEKLLSALKPYLRSERGEIIDKAVSMMKITDMLGALQQMDSGEKEK